VTDALAAHLRWGRSGEYSWLIYMRSIDVIGTQLQIDGENSEIAMAFGAVAFKNPK
jgi:hypothetical protein